MSAVPCAELVRRASKGTSSCTCAPSTSCPQAESCLYAVVRAAPVRHGPSKAYPPSSTWCAVEPVRRLYAGLGCTCMRNSLVENGTLAPIRKGFSTDCPTGANYAVLNVIFNPDCFTNRDQRVSIWPVEDL
jgi:hypothetical protein